MHGLIAIKDKFYCFSVYYQHFSAFSLLIPTYARGLVFIFCFKYKGLINYLQKIVKKTHILVILVARKDQNTRYDSNS